MIDSDAKLDALAAQAVREAFIKAATAKPNDTGDVPVRRVMTGETPTHFVTVDVTVYLKPRKKL